jgi:hypothetical protein
MCYIFSMGERLMSSAFICNPRMHVHDPILFFCRKLTPKRMACLPLATSPSASGSYRWMLRDQAGCGSP